MADLAGARKHDLAGVEQRDQGTVAPARRIMIVDADLHAEQGTELLAGDSRQQAREAG